jgi:hypothetical protein
VTSFGSQEFTQRWHSMTFLEQMGNISSEVDRIAQWKKKGNEEYATKALWRSLDLLDLTIADPRWRGRLKELCRLREFLCDLYVGDNTYGFTAEYFSKYFLQFAIAARRQAGK